MWVELYANNKVNKTRKHIVYVCAKLYNSLYSSYMQNNQDVSGLEPLYKINFFQLKFFTFLSFQIDFYSEVSSNMFDEL